jgi:hypothetical protein
MFKKFKERRELRRVQRALLEYLLDYVQKGGDLMDLFLPQVDAEIEWDKNLQTWKVLIPVWDFVEDDGQKQEAPVDGQKIFLTSSRGGMEENGWITGSLGGNWYGVTFNIKEGGDV